MTWYAVNAALSLVLIALIIRVWLLGRSRTLAERQYREAESKVMQLLLELARKGLQ